MRRSMKGIARRVDKTRVRKGGKTRVRKGGKTRVRKGGKTRVRKGGKTRVRKGGKTRVRKGDKHRVRKETRKRSTKVMVGGTMTAENMFGRDSESESESDLEMPFEEVCEPYKVKAECDSVEWGEGSPTYEFLDNIGLLEYKDKLKRVAEEARVSFFRLEYEDLYRIDIPLLEKNKLIQRLEQYNNGGAEIERYMAIERYKKEKREREVLNILGVTMEDGEKKSISTLAVQKDRRTPSDAEETERHLEDARGRIGKWRLWMRPRPPRRHLHPWNRQAFIGRITELNEHHGVIKVEYARGDAEWYELGTVNSKMIEEKRAIIIDQKVEAYHIALATNNISMNDHDPYSWGGWAPDAHRDLGMHACPDSIPCRPPPPLEGFEISKCRPLRVERLYKPRSLSSNALCYDDSMADEGVLACGETKGKISGL